MIGVELYSTFVDQLLFRNKAIPHITIVVGNEDVSFSLPSNFDKFFIHEVTNKNVVGLCTSTVSLNYWYNTELMFIPILSLLLDITILPTVGMKERRLEFEL